MVISVTLPGVRASETGRPRSYHLPGDGLSRCDRRSQGAAPTSTAEYPFPVYILGLTGRNLLKLRRLNTNSH